MPFVFEQPNLDNAGESHLYFDPGDGRLITVFTNEERVPDPTRTSTDIGAVHHVAFSLSQATFHQAVERLNERGIRHSGVKDRGFMESIYFEDPLGLLIELASYRFEPPFGSTHADVLLEAHKIRVERGDYNIAQEHLADAIERLSERLADERGFDGFMEVWGGDLRTVLEALKPQNPGIAVPKPEVHPNLNIKTFTPPEDLMEQIHEAAVEELLGRHGRVVP